MEPTDNDQQPITIASPSSSMHPRIGLRRQRFIVIISVLLSLAAGFYIGFRYVTYQNAKSADTIIAQIVNKDGSVSRAIDFGLFWQVWDKLHERYVDPNKLDAQKLVYGAISGMVDSVGDPYTVFLEPVMSKEFAEQIRGAFSGVGMEIGKRNGVITVIAPIKDSPAMRAGIIAGDVVAKVDGQSTATWSTEEAVSRIRGEQGTVVNITIIRDGRSDPLELSLTRDTIKVPAIDWRLIDGHIAYMQIMLFNANVESQFISAAQAILASGADRLIIDVRDNPGGLLDSAVNIAGWLLKQNSVVVQEKLSDGSIELMRTSGNAKLASMPLLVLMNGGSASASEILAGAVHDIRNIHLVGEKSFGKGSVQQVEDFSNGSSLKVTVAKWLTPNGVSISDTGITPTDVVPMDPKDAEAKGWILGTPGKDPQLDKALEIIKNLP